MKRIIVSLFALALCVLAGAQTIKKGDCFYDGQNHLTDVLQATQNWNAQEQNVALWMAPLCGEYRTEVGKSIVIGEKQSLLEQLNVSLIQAAEREKSNK